MGEGAETGWAGGGGDVVMLRGLLVLPSVALQLLWVESGTGQVRGVSENSCYTPAGRARTALKLLVLVNVFAFESLRFCCKVRVGKAEEVFC